jgi:hypothetical protein
MTSQTGKPTKGHGSRYLLLREQAIAALVLFGDSEKAAKHIGIPARTFRGWMVREDFVQAVQELRQQMRTGALAQLTGMLQEAVEGLKFEAKNAPKSMDRIRAWRSLASLEERLGRDEMKERLEAVERQLAVLQHGMGTRTYIQATVSREAVEALLRSKEPQPGISVAPEALEDFLADSRPAAEATRKVIEHKPVDTASETPANP